MEDRNVQFPQRYRLQKVAGTDDIFDLIPAPGEIAAEGTFLNKAALLKDATAALFGLDKTAVPDDVLALLSRFQARLGNEYLWEKIAYSEVLEEYAPGGTGMPLAYNGRGTPQYSDEIRILEDGTVEMVDPISTTAAWVMSNYTSLVGKYYINDDTSSGTMNNILFKIGEDVQWYINGSTSINVTAGVYKVTAEAAINDYVNSPDPSAYPPAVSDGFTYNLLGQLANLGAKVETGSYTGTGTYGASNPNSLTFGFVPKLLFVMGNCGIYAVANSQYGISFWSSGGNNYRGVTVNWSNNTVSWYGNSDAQYQCNISGFVYSYVAIG